MNEINNESMDPQSNNPTPNNNKKSNNKIVYGKTHSLRNKEKQKQKIVLQYDDQIQQGIVMYHNGSSSKSNGCIQMEAATYIARYLLQEEDDNSLYHRLCENNGFNYYSQQIPKKKKNQVQFDCLQMLSVS
jgi:hypothetical protein